MGKYLLKYSLKYPLTLPLPKIQGKMTGQTLLPMPMNVEQIFEAELKAYQTGGLEVDARLKSDIEAIVMKWCWQIGDVLSQESTHASDAYPLPSAGTRAQPELNSLRP